MNKLLRLLGIRRSLPSVLRGFNDTIAELNALASANENRVEKNVGRILRISAKNSKLSADAASALTVADRLTKLVS